MIRSFHVRPVLNGYIVDIGCQQVVFTSISSLITAIESYLSNPERVENDWLKNSLNAKHKFDVPDQCEEPRNETQQACDNEAPRFMPGSFHPPR